MIGSSKSIWGFDPRSIPGCVLWLDAADTSTLTLSGSNITALRDKSGLSNHVTDISTIQPKYSSADSSINFESSSSMYLRGTMSTTYSNDTSVFIVTSVKAINQLSSGIVTTFAGNGNPTYVDGTGTNASFQYPGGITINNSGTTYVVDTWNHRIRTITSQGVVSTLAGNGKPTFLNGTGTNSAFAYPSQCVIDTAGNLYVADTNNHRIRRITSGGVVTTLAGSGVIGSSNSTGVSATFNTPCGITISLDNTRLFVTELYGNYVRQIIISTSVVTTLAGSGTASSTDGVGIGASFFYPFPITTDPFGNLYVGDVGSHRIRKINISTTEVTTFAGSSVGTNNGTGTNAQFNYPSGITTDEFGNLYLAEANTPRIRKITTLGVVTTFAGSETSQSMDGTGSNASFVKPRQLLYDSTGIIHLVDEIGCRIRRINTKETNLTYSQLFSLGSNAATQNNLVGQSICRDINSPNLFTFVNESGNPTGLINNAQTYISGYSYETPIIMTNITTLLNTGEYTINTLSNGDGQIYSSRLNSATINSSNLVTYNKYVLGGNINITATPSTSFNGKIFECLIFNSKLLTNQRIKIEYYLAKKWNMISSLSVNPYTITGKDLALSYFTPLNQIDFEGCRLWLDASDPTTITISNSLVTRWRSKIFPSIELTGTGSTYTLVNSYPSIQFNGNSYVTTSNPIQIAVDSSPSNTAYTTFIVQTTSNTTTSGTLFSLAGIILTTDSSGNITVQGGGAVNNPSISGFSQSVNTPQILTFSRNSNTMGARINGSQRTVTLNASTFCNITSGGTYGISTWNGNMFETQHYNRSLSTIEIERVEGYLANKWNLTSLLPITHSYKNFPSTIEYVIPPTVLSYPSAVLTDGNRGRIIALSSNETFKWSTSISSFLGQLRLHGVIDLSGNVYVSIDHSKASQARVFGTSNQLLLTIPTISATQQWSNTALVKFSPSGSLLWSLLGTNTTSNGYTNIEDMIVSVNDNLFLSVYAPNSSTFSNSDGTVGVTAGGGKLILQYSGSGFYAGGQRFTAASNTHGITSNEVYTLNTSNGWTYGSWIGNGVYITPTSSNYSAGIGFGGRDSLGNIYGTGGHYQKSVAGTAGNFTIQGIGNSLSLVNRGPGDTSGQAVLVKFSSTGFILWGVGIRGGSTRGYTGINNLITDSNNDVIIIGRSPPANNTVTFYNSNDSSVGRNLSLTTPDDSFIAKYSSSGMVLWVNKIEFVHPTTRVVLGPSNSFYVVCTTYNTNGSNTKFYNPGNILVEEAKCKCVCLLKYSSNGYLLSRKTLIWNASSPFSVEFTRNSSGEMCIVYQVSEKEAIYVNN